MTEWIKKKNCDFLFLWTLEEFHYEFKVFLDMM